MSHISNIKKEWIKSRMYYFHTFIEYYKSINGNLQRAKSLTKICLNKRRMAD